MKLHHMKATALLLLACFLLLAGCAAEQPQTRRYVWPRPPEQPRIEWVKSYYSQHSFPKTGFQSAIELLLGESPPIIFEKPIDIKSNGKGIVYVTDIALAAIVVYDLNKQSVELWSRGSDPENSMTISPYYISIDSDNNVYVVGNGAKVIYVLDSKGTVRRKIDYAGHVASAGGIVIDNSEKRIYLVDWTDSKVAVFGLDGKFLFSFGKTGQGDGELNHPSPICMNHKGEVIVGDVMNARVQVFSKDGKFLRKFGQRGDTGPDLQIIKGVAVDRDDNIYVTDGKANQMKIFSSKGDYLLSIGTAYSITKTAKEAPGGFLLPQGIYIDENDMIYIADQANMRFQIFKYLPDTPAEAGGQDKGKAIK